VIDKQNDTDPVKHELRKIIDQIKARQNRTRQRMRKIGVKKVRGGLGLIQ